MRDPSRRSGAPLEDPTPPLAQATALGEDWDDRIHCGLCRQADGIYCRAAQAGILHGTSKMASPMPTTIKWRCEGFVPLPTQADQRTGAQRWPGLAHKTKRS